MMTKEDLTKKRGEIVDQLLIIAEQVKQLNIQKESLIDELMELEPEQPGFTDN
jgi:hypothetical protein